MVFYRLDVIPVIQPSLTVNLRQDLTVLENLLLDLKYKSEVDVLC